MDMSNMIKLRSAEQYVELVLKNPIHGSVPMADTIWKVAEATRGDALIDVLNLLASSYPHAAKLVLDLIASEHSEIVERERLKAGSNRG